MAGEWRFVTIADIAEKVAMGPFGSSIKVETFVPEGVPVISGQHLHGSKINDEVAYNFITPAHAEKLKNANVRRGDVIFTHAGNIGQVAFVPWNSRFERYVISQRQFYMRCDTSKAIPEYVVAYFKTPEGQHKLLANTSQVGVPSIAQPVTYLRTIDLPLPPLPEQRAIAHILGTLDDKIELNRRMNETLEGMARAIFKSWFVDFDPVRAKMRGEQPAGLAPSIAALFPDALVETELGEAPVGWEVGSFLDIADLLSGGTPSTSNPDYWNGDIPWVSAKDVSGAKGSFLLNTEKTVSPLGVRNSSTKILPARTTIITARGTVGSYCLLGSDMAMNQTNYGLRAKKGVGDYFVFFSTAQLVEHLRQHAYGTIFDTITTKTFRDTRIVQPAQPVSAKFDETVEALMARTLGNAQQTATLAALRDTLLPRLISGELRVADAERIIGREI